MSIALSDIGMSSAEVLAGSFFMRLKAGFRLKARAMAGRRVCNIAL